MVCLNLFNKRCSAQRRLCLILILMPEATVSGETASKHTLQLLQLNLYAMLRSAVLFCAAVSCAVLCHAVLH